MRLYNRIGVWLGNVWSADGDKIWSSGGGNVWKAAKLSGVRDYKQAILRDPSGAPPTYVNYIWTPCPHFPLPSPSSFNPDQKNDSFHALSYLIITLT